MTEDNDKLQTHDQFLVEHGVVPNPERKADEKLRKTTKNLAKNGAILALVLHHTLVATEAIDKQAKLEEQLKFQGLRAYARINNLWLSTRVIDHFLYGNGENLDITQEFANALREDSQSEFSSPQTQGITEDMNTEQVYEKYIQNTFSRIVCGPDTEEKAVFARTLDPSGKEIYHTADELHALVGQDIRIFRIDRYPLK